MSSQDDRPARDERAPRDRAERPAPGRRADGADRGPRRADRAPRERRLTLRERRGPLPPLPPISFPEDLPVSQLREEIADAIREHQVVIVAGETGSGKTTQLPKICLELGREMIGHTQPRRIAARTIAERIASELGSELGGLVGYQVRFTDEVSDETRVKLMTDGILLNEIHRDRELRAYDTIIIDEAHERSLNIDFLLGYLKRLLPKRPDLKVIITSATIDPESFARHFATPRTPGGEPEPAPIIEVSGRTFPVEIRYRPLVPDAITPGPNDGDVDDDAPQRTPERDLFEGICDALDELEREEPGDVLVFLPGEQEIRDAQDAIRGHLQRSRMPEATEVLPLFGRLSAADQHRVFETSRRPGVRRRVVLATNVAETSLTVPGIAYVIDAGTARISRYSTKAKVQRLPIEAVSQASANQRSGRSGRTRPGIAIRLYSEADFERRPAFTDPEILRTNLASVILQALELGLGGIDRFPFLQAPDPRGVKDGLDLLRELGAIEEGPAPAKGRRGGAKDGEADGAGNGHEPRARRHPAPGPRLTRIGRELSRLPIDPRYGRMVVESKRHDVSRDVLIIVAGLAVQDIRERPLEQRQKADSLHARFTDPTSDFLTLLNLWRYLEAKSGELGSSAFRRLCRDEFLNFLRFREWQDVFRQLRQMSSSLGLRVEKPHGDDEPGARADAIHKSVLAGLLSHLGVRDELKREYVGARNQRFLVFPGSGLAKSGADAIMAAELVETSRLFARTVAKIDPAWAEELAGPLAKRRHSDPHWERKLGQAVAIEQVTLYGVPIVRDRRVQLARFDPRWARDLFIRHALVEGDWTGAHAFDRRNTQLRRELAALEDRVRRRDVLGDDADAVFEFYDERLPDEVVSQASFEQWWREAQKHQPELLTMRRGDLLEDEADAEADADRFPTQWRQGDQRLKLRYRFDPGAADDGVTAQIPLPLLARLDPVGFDWQVPGMRAELVTALLRSLPKAIRRSFVPAADWAETLLAAPVPLGKGGGTRPLGEFRPDLGEEPPGPLDETLRGVMQTAAGIRFDVEEFEWAKVPAHLRMRFRVLDDRGRELGAGEELLELQSRLKRAAEASLVRAAREATGLGAGAGSVKGSGVGKGAASAPAAGSGASTRDDASDAVSPDLEQTDVSTFPVHELPAYVDLRRKSGVIRAYPALRLAKGGRVDLGVVTTAEDQAREHPKALRRLLAKSVPSPVSYVQEHLTAQEKLLLTASPYPSVQALLEDVVLALAAETLAAAPDPMVRTRAEFERLRDELNARVVDALFDEAKRLAAILGEWRKAEAALKGANHRSVLPSLSDARAQLDGLIRPGFVRDAGIARLRHFPRYLKAATHRLERVRENPALERAGLQQIQQAIGLFEEAGGSIPLPDDAPDRLVRARWMLEELRVSLFAQQLGTAETVSVKRLRQALAEG
ncbi:hypothetical protein USB125703_01269 [Pseudoclavibacter triregionum]|nr:hypothetical protein USB125703_01269 [Pseudoclavibacter triregionum]